MVEVDDPKKFKAVLFSMTGTKQKTSVNLTTDPIFHLEGKITKEATKKQQVCP